MMMAEMPVQKRRNDGFFHLNCEDVDGRGGGKLNAKRLKGACGSAPPIPRERKDKIGERVAALQQLVSPYGKTDTASVLQEVGGYIKFLHEQLEVLSAPYLQAPLRSIGNSNVSPNPHSLRSRGLCLVPVAYSRQLAGTNGADMWAPNNTKSS